MYRNRTKRVIASILAAAMIVPAAVNPAFSMTASAAELVGESDFDYKIIPWHVIEASPAKQDFELDDGALHIMVLRPEGAEKERYDLRVQHPNLDFRKGHTYEVSFKVKAARNGMELYSRFTTPNLMEEYFSTERDGTMSIGPYFNGKWGECMELTTEYQTVSGTFTPTKDLEGVVWTMEYASGETYGGNAQDGDELWFDEMHIIDKEGVVIPKTPVFTARVNSGLEGNYISVNQLGYYPDLAKIAVLGSDEGASLPDAQPVELKGEYHYQIIDAATGEEAYSGKTGSPQKDKDSGDTICKIDFSEFKTPGEYYIYIPACEWRSFPFRIANDIYQEENHNLLTDALNYFYQNRAGQDIEAGYITTERDRNQLAHKDPYMNDTAYVQDAWVAEYTSRADASEVHASSKITANGGWYDAKTDSKNLISGGYSCWMLQNMYERAKDNVVGMGGSKFKDGSGTCVVPESGNKVPDILDECRQELDFMDQMRVKPDEKTWGQYDGLYYHSIQDYKPTGFGVKHLDYIGEEEDLSYQPLRIVQPPTFAATLSYAACAAQAARLWQDYDFQYSEHLLQSAKEAYAAFKTHYYEANLLDRVDPYTGEICAAEDLESGSLYAPVNMMTNVPYGDHDVLDEAYWAACELFITASIMDNGSAGLYFTDLNKYDQAYKVPTRIKGGMDFGDGDGSFTMMNTGNMAAAGTLTLALHPELLPETADWAEVEDSIQAAADEFLMTEEMQGYGIPYLYDGPGFAFVIPGQSSVPYGRGYEQGSNARALSNMLAMAYAYDLTGKSKYLNGVSTGMDYLLGTNPLSFSYITGYGSYTAKNPSHNYWAREISSDFPQAPDGVLSGGPSVLINDDYMKHLGFSIVDEDLISQRCYADSIEATSVNSAALEYNAMLAWAVSFLQDEGPSVEPTPEKFVWGDANKDNKTDVSDAVLLARFLAEDSGAVLTSDGKLRANVIRGELDHDDLTAILMSIAKIIDGDTFPLDKFPSAE